MSVLQQDRKARVFGKRFPVSRRKKHFFLEFLCEGFLCSHRRSCCCENDVSNTNQAVGGLATDTFFFVAVCTEARAANPKLTRTHPP